MTEPRFCVTMKDIQKYRVLKDIVDKKVKGVQAALILGITPVHVCRLKRRFIEHGLTGLLRPRHPAPNKISAAKASIIADIYKEHYWDFNIMHFKDKLKEIHKITLSYESVRKILISHGIHAAKKKKIVHRRRRRMPKAGMLVQMDSSIHRWLEHIPQTWALVAMIDDASSEVPYAQFFPSDTTLANMHVIRRFIEIKGVFMALYVDKAVHFTTTRYQGIHYNVNPEQDDTQIERALSELNINLIPANSPQAKGRIERLFRLFQDRLVKEMRLANVSTYPQANKFIIDKFLPWYNTQFTIPNLESVYTPVPFDKNLDLVFSIKKERIVNHDNTIKFCGQIIQIPPSDTRLSFAKAIVDVCLLNDNSIIVQYKNQTVATSKLHGNNLTVKKDRFIKNLLNSRNYEPALT